MNDLGVAAPQTGFWSSERLHCLVVPWLLEVRVKRNEQLHVVGNKVPLLSALKRPALSDILMTSPERRMSTMQDARHRQSIYTTSQE
jgi:hypothetical protein